jgi:hypothetical protein
MLIEAAEPLSAVSAAPIAATAPAVSAAAASVPAHHHCTTAAAAAAVAVTAAVDMTRKLSSLADEVVLIRNRRTAQQRRLSRTIWMRGLASDVMDASATVVYQDMSQPLSHYFLDSSHNA